MKVLFCALLVVALLTVCEAGKKKKSAKLKPWQVKRMLGENVKEIRAVIEDHLSSCLSEYDDDTKSTRQAYDASVEALSMINGLKKKSKQCRKQRPMPPREDTDPCTQNLQVGFREVWNDTTGDMTYNMSILSNSSVRDCNAGRTWFSLKDITEGVENMTAGDYEHLLALCPPRPECIAYVTRSWTQNGTSFPSNCEAVNVTLLTNYVGPCKNDSGYSMLMEVKSCRTSDEPDRVVFRLPNGCPSRDICGEAKQRWMWETPSPNWMPTAESGSECGGTGGTDTAFGK